MIHIRVIYDGKRDFLGFHMEGHAGYAEEGYDIICSAVSSLALNMINSLEAYTDIGFRYEASDEGGLLKFRFTQKPDHDSSLLFKSMLLGLKAIQEQYGEEYLWISYLQKLADHQFTRIHYQEV